MNLYIKTTITSLVGTFVYWLLGYLNNSVEWVEVVVFAVVFWVVFLVGQKFFTKNNKK